MTQSTILTDEQLAITMLDLLAERGAGKSICPSEVPRRLLGEQGPWRSFLRRTRAVAAGLHETGEVAILRKGKPVEPSAMRGVVRLGQGPRFGEPTGSDTPEVVDDKPDSRPDGAETDAQD